MTLRVPLLNDDLPVKVDNRTARLGGGFCGDPLRVYAPAPLGWAWGQLKVQKRPVLLDVGASTGCYTLLAAHHPGLTVFAFEPVPLTAEVLRANVRLNRLTTRARVIEAGVADYNGAGQMNIVQPESQSALSILNGKPGVFKEYAPVVVPVLTLDAFCQAANLRPTVIKIDVEGGELLVLKGAAETLKQYHPVLIVESIAENTAQFGYNPDTITNFLNEFGYQQTRMDGGDILAA